MCFDVLKVVWSPGYDHGHDKESRNGRDVKIDILDEYSDTGSVPGDFEENRSAGELPEPRRGTNGPHGP